MKYPGIIEKKHKLQLLPYDINQKFEKEKQKFTFNMKKHKKLPKKVSISPENTLTS